RGQAPVVRPSMPCRCVRRHRRNKRNGLANQGTAAGMNARRLPSRQRMQTGGARPYSMSTGRTSDGSRSNRCHYRTQMLGHKVRVGWRGCQMGVADIAHYQLGRDTGCQLSGDEAMPNVVRTQPAEPFSLRDALEGQPQAFNAVSCLGTLVAPQMLKNEGRE